MTAKSTQTVLLIGLRSDSVNFEKWPQLSVEKLEASFKQVISELATEGYAATWCLTDTGETAEAEVINAIEQHNPDFVLIGAGVRTDPDHFLLFEKVINIVHTNAPKARILFNTLPYDSLEAVKRWS